jgi:Domain of unknown function (DUF892)
VAEGEEVLAKHGDPVAKDAAIIAAAQRIEHYEIAAYGTARTLADELDQKEAKELFAETLDEESAADVLLTKIATAGMFKSGSTRLRRANDPARDSLRASPACLTRLSGCLSRPRRSRRCARDGSG